MAIPTNLFFITLLGRTQYFDRGGLVDTLRNIGRCKFFVATNTSLKGWPQLKWVVDQPVDVSSFTDGNVDSFGPEAEFIGPVEGFDFSLLDLFGKPIDWTNCISLAGIAGEGENETEVSLVSKGGSDCEIGIGVVTGANLLERLQGILSGLVGHGAVAFESNGKVVNFRIHERQFKDCKLVRVGYSLEISGMLMVPSFHINVPGFDGRRSVFDRLTALCSDIRWGKIGVSTPNQQNWKECLRWCRKQKHTPWLQSQIAASKEVWTVESFIEKGLGYEVINFGSLKFPKKDSGGLVPKELRGLEVKVDGFREGDGWHLAFHTFERGLDDVPRRKATAALNALLGGNLINRTPETLWPRLFPMTT